MSTRAPDVFHAEAARFKDSAAQAVRDFWEDNRGAIDFVARNRDALVPLLEGPIDIADVRSRELGRRAAVEQHETAAKVREAMASMEADFRELQPYLVSIVAAWERSTAEMLDAYRKRYPYADHIDRLEFPRLDLRALKDDCGLGGLTSDNLWACLLPLAFGGDGAGRMEEVAP